MAFELFLRKPRQTRRFHSRVPGPECRAASRPGATALCGTERGREVSSHLIGFLVWSSLCGKRSFSPAWETAHGFRSVVLLFRLHDARRLPGLLHQLNLAWAPLLGKEWFLRAVEAQQQEPTLARHRLNIQQTYPSPAAVPTPRKAPGSRPSSAALRRFGWARQLAMETNLPVLQWSCHLR